MGAQLAQYNAAGSFAYSPTGTPMLAAHQAPAAGQMQSYGHAGFNSNSSARQEQQQSYASAVRSLTPLSFLYTVLSTCYIGEP